MELNLVNLDQLLTQDEFWKHDDKRYLNMALHFILYITHTNINTTTKKVFLALFCQ